MKKILVFGTFDLLHPGHNHFFSQAKSLGDYLVVVVATDNNAKRAKGHSPQFSQKDRLAKVAAQTEVDQALLGSPTMDYLTTIKEINPQTIALGYDQSFPEEKLKKELADFGLKNIQVIRLKAYQPHKYKSSILKKVS